MNSSLNITIFLCLENINNKVKEFYKNNIKSLKLNLKCFLLNSKLFFLFLVIILKLNNQIYTVFCFIWVYFLINLNIFGVYFLWVVPHALYHLIHHQCIDNFQYFQQCNVNPCTHGGTCWSSGDSFYCACRPGYTGTMCEGELARSSADFPEKSLA